MENSSINNTTAASILRNSLRAAFGLFFCAVGVYFTIQANIGVDPWSVFAQGISKQTGISLGNMLTLTSIAVIGVDLLLKEKIGIGTILDALIVGQGVNLFMSLNVVEAADSLPKGVCYMLIGMLIQCYFIQFYMKAGLSCGPRDTLVIGLCHKFPRANVGIINTVLFSFLTLTGWLLGGQVGIGTLMCVLLMGYMMQTVFGLCHFKVASVYHQSVIASFAVLTGSRGVDIFTERDNM